MPFMLVPSLHSGVIPAFWCHFIILATFLPEPTYPCFWDHSFHSCAACILLADANALLRQPRSHYNNTTTSAIKLYYCTHDRAKRHLYEQCWKNAAAVCTPTVPVPSLDKGGRCANHVCYGTVSLNSNYTIIVKEFSQRSLHYNFKLEFAFSVRRCSRFLWCISNSDRDGLPAVLRTSFLNAAKEA